MKMGLVTFPLDSGPKLAVGQSMAWWSGLLGGLAEEGNFVSCIINVVLFIGLGRAYRLGDDVEVIKWGESHKSKTVKEFETEI